MGKKRPNKAVIEKWATVLEYGGYTQGKGSLRRERVDKRGDKLCCLGVLCEIAVKDGVIPSPLGPIEHSGSYRYGGDGESGAYLPLAVMEWAGFDSPDPATSVGEDHGKRTLSYLNDQLGYTFPMIAEQIRKDFLPKPRVKKEKADA